MDDAAFFEVAGGSDLDVLNGGVGWEVFPACVEGVFDLSGVVNLGVLNADDEEECSDESLHGGGVMDSEGVRTKLMHGCNEAAAVLCRLGMVFEFFVKPRATPWEFGDEVLKLRGRRFVLCVDISFGKSNRNLTIQA